jgi:hypothetical protein
MWTDPPKQPVLIAILNTLTKIKILELQEKLKRAKQQLLVKK